MIPASYPLGEGASENGLVCDHNRRWRLLIVPALFDEGNKLRRFTVELMRRFDKAGIDSFLPDLPGTNESLAPLRLQSPLAWRAAMAAAANHFGATHVLGIRGGALFAPEHLPCWLYAPVNGAVILRTLLRARILTGRESGHEESQDQLLAAGSESGIVLCGYALGPTFFSDFPSFVPPVAPHIAPVEQEQIGGSGLWLRAEPDEDARQADALAALVAMGLKA